MMTTEILCKDEDEKKDYPSVILQTLEEEWRWVNI